MVLPRRKSTMSRRGFLKTAVKATTAIGATAIGVKVVHVGISATKTMQALRQKKASKLALLKLQLKAAQIPNHSK